MTQHLRETASIALLSTLLAASSAYADGTQTRIGDALSIAIPLATAGTEFFRGEHEGAIQYTEALAASVGATELLKYTVRSERPDHSDDHSFPSLHATSAFSAATYVNRRYGLEQALPLYALATYVGYTRVQADQHRWSDVAGSAVLTAARELVAGQPPPRSESQHLADGRSTRHRLPHGRALVERIINALPEQPSPTLRT